MNARTLFTEPDDLVAAELAGQLHHIITLTALEPCDIAAWLDKPITGYKQSRFAGIFQYRFRLTGLTPGEARRMTDRLATLPEVAGAQVEHVIFSESSARTDDKRLLSDYIGSHNTPL
ncbi:hypothetical protein [Asticcacaulis taihuensis]|uniref:Uncharacterized protein n=1 Tax=Asticcacaulis taihuensis TaxID=260084 RepID=A0A1G4RLU2_9CAUL|nr:hypothetical protein [Asticcacaulis taihuensis]SCW57159.1 hypothetical protein SAMN02927928_2002 [Asticcacaulis taihuensis]